MKKICFIEEPKKLSIKQMGNVYGGIMDCGTLTGDCTTFTDNCTTFTGNCTGYTGNCKTFTSPKNSYLSNMY